MDMKRKGRIAAAFAVLPLCAGILAGCAEREPEETEPRETVRPEFDIELFREEYEAREDQEGFVPYNSKYGFDLPEIDSWTDGFEDYLGYSVTFTDPYDGMGADYLLDDRGGVFVFPERRGTPVYDPFTGDFLPAESNLHDGIVYYDAEGIPKRICQNPDCAVGEICTHGMSFNIADYSSIVRYWNGCLYFTGSRVEEDPTGEWPWINRTYVMRYDIETGVFSKLIEFFDQDCFMFVIRDGVIFMTTGTVNDRWLCSVDLREGVACRVHVGQADPRGIVEGRILLQRSVYGKSWYEVEHTLYLLDPETGAHRNLDTYTTGPAGAAGRYAVYLKKWQRGVSADLMRRDPWAEEPEVMDRDVVKFQMIGERCVWLRADGTLWRSNVGFFRTRKIGTGVIDFRVQDDGRILFLSAKRFPGVNLTKNEEITAATMYISNGYRKEAFWTASPSYRWMGQAAVGTNVAFVTTMYHKITMPNLIPYRETCGVKILLREGVEQTLFRRYYGYASEVFRTYHRAVNDHDLVYYSQKQE
jgi:hypothetical protein